MKIRSSVLLTMPSTSIGWNTSSSPSNFPGGREGVCPHDSSLGGLHINFHPSQWKQLLLCLPALETHSLVLGCV